MSTFEAWQLEVWIARQRELIARTDEGLVLVLLPALPRNDLKPKRRYTRKVKA